MAELPTPAPDFLLPDLQGQVVRLSQLKGKVVLLNVWTTWCPPCRKEMPALEALYRRLLHVYECKKTEFIGDTEEERRYSYWIECDAARRCISVLPGKFSFFPTVAWQTYK